MVIYMGISACCRSWVYAFLLKSAFDSGIGADEMERCRYDVGETKIEACPEVGWW